MTQINPNNFQEFSELHVDIVTPIYTGIVLDDTKLAERGYQAEQEKIIHEMNKGMPSQSKWDVPEDSTTDTDSQPSVTQMNQTSASHASTPAPISSIIAPNRQPWGGSYYPNYLLENTIHMTASETCDPSSPKLENYGSAFEITISQLNVKISHYGFLLITTRATIKSSQDKYFFIRNAIRGLRFFWENIFNDSISSDIKQLVDNITIEFSNATKKFGLQHKEHIDYFKQQFGHFENQPVWAHPIYYTSQQLDLKNEIFRDIPSTPIAIADNTEFGFIGSPYSCLYSDHTDDEERQIAHTKIKEMSFKVIQDACVFDSALELTHRMLYTYAKSVYNSGNKNNIKIPDLQILSKGIIALIQINSQLEAQISQYNQGLEAEAEPAWEAIKTHWGFKLRQEENTTKLDELERLFSRMMNIATQRQQRLQNQVVIIFSALSLIALLLSIFALYDEEAFNLPTANNWWWITGAISSVVMIVAAFWVILFPRSKRKSN